MYVWAKPDLSHVRTILDQRRAEVRDRVERERARVKARIEEIRKGVYVTPPSEPGDDEGSDPEDPGSGGDTGTAPIVTFAANKSSVASGETVTLTWSTEDADRCTASGASDWQGAKSTAGTGSVVVQATTTYTLACGNEHGTTTKDTIVGAYVVEDSDPEPNGAVLITEVHFNPSAEAGQGNNTDNEWVELYNGTAHTVDLMGWSIRDNTFTDVLSATPLSVPSHGYVVVTRATSTDTYWQYGQNAVVIHLNSALGNGLGNSGDSLTLHNAEGVTIDALSWGMIEDPVMDPSVSIAGMPAGASLERIDHAVDTDTAGDWKQQATPTPGK